MENTNNTATNHSFNDLGIALELLVVLKRLNFIIPTPIQHQAIPASIQGKDIVGIAQTGTGKTLAFGIPMIQRIAKAQGKNRGLILLPTRELALQVNETLQKIASGFGMRTTVLIGGDSIHRQIQSLRNNPHIIIGTPGRINDHLKQRTLHLKNISLLVLDEADCMLDMGFTQQIKQIMASLPKERQTLLFSATMPDAIIKIANMYMKFPLRVEIAPPGTTAEKVEHELFFVRREQKLPLLKRLLEEYKGSILLFLRTKHGASKTCKQLLAAHFSAAEIHSNKSLAQRKKALDGFRSGRYRILVATDIASRGIDVKGIELVLNYDLPESAEDYVHRIGRTGRAGQAGKAISFVIPEQRNKVREIEKLIRSTIPISKTPELPVVILAQSSWQRPTYKPPYHDRRHIGRKFSRR